MYFDPMYMWFVMPAMLFGLWAQWKVKSAYAKASEVPASSGLSGAEVAAKILETHGIQATGSSTSFGLTSRSLKSVGIEPINSYLGDHYDPKAKMLRLSPDVYNGRSLAALGIAAHEVGHAIQDAEGYAPLVLRNGIVPLASVGGYLWMILVMIGGALNSFNLIAVGIGLFSIIVFFQLINLPVEFNASSRAKEILLQRGFISASEQKVVSHVLDAAALTYVAATISAIMTLLYYLMRFGIIGGRRDD